MQCTRPENTNKNYWEKQNRTKQKTANEKWERTEKKRKQHSKKKTPNQKVAKKAYNTPKWKPPLYLSDFVFCAFARCVCERVFFVNNGKHGEILFHFVESVKVKLQGNVEKKKIAPGHWIESAHCILYCLIIILYILWTTYKERTAHTWHGMAICGPSHH